MGKWYFANFGTEATDESSHIVLQAEDAEVEFRKVELMRIAEMSTVE